MTRSGYNRNQPDTFSLSALPLVNFNPDLVSALGSVLGSALGIPGQEHVPDGAVPDGAAEAAEIAAADAVDECTFFCAPGVAVDPDAVGFAVDLGDLDFDPDADLDADSDAAGAPIVSGAAFAPTEGFSL